MRWEKVAFQVVSFLAVQAKSCLGRHEIFYRQFRFLWNFTSKPDHSNTSSVCITFFFPWNILEIIIFKNMTLLSNKIEKGQLKQLCDGLEENLPEKILPTSTAISKSTFIVKVNHHNTSLYFRMIQLLSEIQSKRWNFKKGSIYRIKQKL